jgi:hypothetical protein
MSKLSSFYRKKIKPIKGKVGKVLDIGSDFLPPGFRDVGNFVGKRLEGQSTKQAAIGTGADYLGGRIIKGALGKAKKLTSGGGAANGGIPAFPGSGLPEVGPIDMSGVDASVARKVASIPGIGGGFGEQAAAAIGPRLGAGAASAIASNSNGNGSGIVEGEPRGSGSWWKKPGVAEAGIGLAGNIIQGYGQGKIADADRKWDREKFGQELGWEKDQYGMNNAPGLQRQIEAAPMRDRAMYMLAQRMGMPQSDFSPRDIFNPGGTGSLGGFDQNQINTANAAYTPGAGGTDPTILKQILQKMGYGQPPIPAPGQQPGPFPGTPNALPPVPKKPASVTDLMKGRR